MHSVLCVPAGLNQGAQLSHSCHKVGLDPEGGVCSKVNGKSFTLCVYVCVWGGGGGGGGAHSPPA